MGFYASLPVSVGISLKMPPRSPAFPTCRHSSLKSVASTLKSVARPFETRDSSLTPYVPIVSAANMLKLVASTIKYVGSSVFSRSVFSSSAFSSSVLSTSVFSSSVLSTSVLSTSVFSSSVFSTSVFSTSVF
ncbi:hypothetical protein PF004_g3937 [Phytophthora fragariae]|uniref:Uncharacterized protein n=1 Tax=Phytophthora fragariae TaxID=53985 RepID=A0A6G0PJX5_9STRA|nr:hypothetical protein PF004_g3937 [Phytophthora fragariae]